MLRLPVLYGSDLVITDLIVLSGCDIQIEQLRLHFFSCSRIDRIFFVGRLIINGIVVRDHSLDLTVRVRKSVNITGFSVVLGQING